MMMIKINIREGGQHWPILQRSYKLGMKQLERNMLSIRNMGQISSLMISTITKLN
jgi:hypothetical protein